MRDKYLLIFLGLIIFIGLISAAMKSFPEKKEVQKESSPKDINELLAKSAPSPTQLLFNQALNKQQIIKEQPRKKVKQYAKFPGELSQAQLENKKAVILTTKGQIEIMIYPEATKAASNFIFLSKDGFYDDLTFHRVVPSFVIQGGDPLGDGTGGPGYQFEDEPVSQAYKRGIAAMANSGPNTNGSQFFIMLADNPLPPNYTIFGKVISGMEVVDQIKAGDLIQKITII